MMATQLRCDAARLLEWFCVCLRNGWVGSHRNRNEQEARPCSPGRRLEATLRARRRHRLDRPYGRAAYRLRFARTDAPPGNAPPDG